MRTATRTADQAAAEAAAGVGEVESATTQRVLTCQNKGSEFIALMLKPDVNALVRHVLGVSFRKMALMKHSFDVAFHYFELFGAILGETVPS